MTRLEFIAQEMMEQTLMKQPVTKQDLMAIGVIGKKEREMDIFIRDSLPRDRTAIRELTLAAYQEYAEPLGVHWESYRDGVLRTLEKVKPAEQLVVEDNGEIVATISTSTTFTVPDGFSITTPFPELCLLAVSPDKRGRGLETVLTRKAIEHAKGQRAKAVMHHTLSVMPYLAQMYKAMGFVRFPRFDFELAPGVVLESYRLDLRR